MPQHAGAPNIKLKGMPAGRGSSFGRSKLPHGRLTGRGSLMLPDGGNSEGAGWGGGLTAAAWPDGRTSAAAAATEAESEARNRATVESFRALS